MMIPTARMRFVERPNTDILTAIHGRTKLRLLQQWWRSDIVTESGEWRDVPLEEESASTVSVTHEK